MVLGMVKILLMALGSWSLGLMVLWLAGQGMSRATVKAVHGSDPNNDLILNVGLRQVYRTLIRVAGWYYYISLPMVIILAFSLTFAVTYGFYRIGRLPLQLILVLAFGALYTAYQILVSFTVKRTLDEEGRPLRPEEAPKLWEVARSVAERVGTRPVDEIRLVFGTEVAVYERGSLKEKRDNKAKRVLLLGVGVLKGFRRRAFEAVLAHEYGHFTHRDTAGGEDALRVQQVMFNFAQRMVASGQANGLNVAYWFLRIYSALFQRITHGATRLQEIMADRVAARLFGSDNFEEGLRHVVREGVVFLLLARGETQSSVNEKRAVANLYQLSSQQLSEQDARLLEEEVNRSMNRPTKEFDTHPSPLERFDYLKGIPKSTATTPDAAVWDFFANPQGIQEEMTAEIAKKLPPVPKVDPGAPSSSTSAELPELSSGPPPLRADLGWTVYGGLGLVIAGLGVLFFTLQSPWWACFWAVLSLSLILWAATLWRRRERLRFVLAVDQETLCIRRGKREERIRFDDLRAVTAGTKYSKRGNEAGQLKRWTVTLQTSAAKVDYQYLAPAEEVLEIQHWTNVLLDRCRAAMETQLKNGVTFTGKGWSLDAQGLRILATGQTVPVAAISAYYRVDANEKFWRDAETDSFLVVKQSSLNSTFLRLFIMERFKEQAMKPLSGLGRLLKVETTTWTRSRIRYYEQGFEKRAWGKESEFRDDEIDSISYQVIRHYYNGIYTGTSVQMTLMAGPRKLRINRSNAGLELLDDIRTRLSERIAERLEKRLETEQEVPWVNRVMLSKTHVIFMHKKANIDPLRIRLSPDMPMDIAGGVCHLYDPDGQTIKIPMSEPNFYPGLKLMIKLAGHRKF